jgi:hypothetical protein
MVQLPEKQLHRRQQQPPRQQQQGKIARQQSVPSFSSSYYLLLFVKILLVLIILLWMAPLVTGGGNNYNRQKRRRLYKVRNLRSACQNENVDCARLVPEESMNCVHQCMSPTCYSRIYAESSTNHPLEDGEVDVTRGQAFETCVQEELRAQLKEQKQQRHRRDSTEPETTDL